MIPILLTLLRIIGTPLVGWAIIAHHTTLAAASFLLLALTDWADGYIARTYNQVTPLGALLDPFADKLLMVTTLGCLAYASPTHVPLWLVILILFKEVSLILGGLYVTHTIDGLTIVPLRSGKYATLLQIVFISYIFLCLQLPSVYRPELYSLLLALALYFIFVSWALYIYKGYALCSPE